MLIMSEFKFLEDVLPHQILVRLELTFQRGTEPDIATLRARMARFGFVISAWSMRADAAATRMVYVLELKSAVKGGDERLAEGLGKAEDILDFLIAREHS